jgi:hypothetical protein
VLIDSGDVRVSPFDTVKRCRCYLLQGFLLQAFLVFTLLLFSALPSLAQHWQVEVTPTGYTSYTHTNSYGTHSYPYPELGEWDGDSGYLPIYTSDGETVTLDASGSYKIKATWVDSNGQPIHRLHKKSFLPSRQTQVTTPLAV